MRELTFGVGKLRALGPFLATNQLGVSYQTARLQDYKLPNCKTKIRLQDCRLQDYIDLHRLHAACYNFIFSAAWWPKGPADFF